MHRDDLHNTLMWRIDRTVEYLRKLRVTLEQRQLVRDISYGGPHWQQPTLMFTGRVKRRALTVAKILHRLQILLRIFETDLIREHPTKQSIRN